MASVIAIAHFVVQLYSTVTFIPASLGQCIGIVVVCDKKADIKKFNFFFASDQFCFLFHNMPKRPSPDPPHPGSPAHVRSTLNYIFSILRRACGLQEGVEGSGVLALLGEAGEDLFFDRIEQPVRLEYGDPRSSEEVLEFYTRQEEIRCRRNCCLENAPVNHAANEGDYKALLLFGGLAKPKKGKAPKTKKPKTGPLAACFGGHERCLAVLRDQKYDLDYRTCRRQGGLTSALLAAENGHEGCLRLLKEAGCDLEQTDEDGWTPAHHAAGKGHEGCLRLLKEAG